MTEPSDGLAQHVPDDFARKNVNVFQDYGISVQELYVMLQEQGNACAIGRELFSGDNPWCVDHYHETGKVRGLLCRKCNWGLGNFDDDPNKTNAATKYLTRERSKASPAEAIASLRREFSTAIAALRRDFVFTVDNTPSKKRALKFIVGWCVSHEHEFNGRNKTDSDGSPLGPSDGWVGWWVDANWIEIEFLPKKLRNILSDGGFNYDQIIEDWRRDGTTKCEGKRNYKRKWVGTHDRENVIAIKRKAFEAFRVDPLLTEQQNVATTTGTDEPVKS